MAIARAIFTVPEVYQMLSTNDGTYPEDGGAAYHELSGIQGGDFNQGIGANELYDNSNFTFAQMQQTTDQYGDIPSDKRSVADGLDVLPALDGEYPDLVSNAITAITIHLLVASDSVTSFTQVPMQAHCHLATNRAAVMAGGVFPLGQLADMVYDPVIDYGSPVWITSSVYTEGDPGSRWDAMLDPANRVAFLPGSGGTDDSLSTLRIYEGYIEAEYPVVPAIDGVLLETRSAFS